MIDLRRLSYLVVLAKRLSYSNAAMDLGLSQSALSRAIQSLERDIEIRLFDRDQSGVRLTEQGRWVVAKAEVLLTNATDFSNQLAFAAKGMEGRIRFGLTAMAAHLLLPGLLTQRIYKAPGFTHEVLIRESEPLYLMLAQGQIEFLVCSELSSVWTIPEVMPVRTESLGKLPVGLVVRRGHPLLDFNTINSKFPILVSSTKSASSALTSELREILGISIQVIEDSQIISSIVRQTDSVWLTCPMVAKCEIARGELCELPMPEGVGSQYFDLYYYVLARRSISPAAVEILQYFSDFISEPEYRSGSASAASVQSFA